MNIHHLELFYYVAKHGGISAAVRKIPYGIQQPAVSAQILQLEDSLGVTLFRRRPFCLMPPGERLYRFIMPFFENLDAVVAPSFAGRALLLSNLTGHPCVVLPNGFSNAGTPTSICFIGKLFGEADILAVAKKYQDSTDFHSKHPPLE